MKDIRTITRHFIINGNDYHVCRFNAETETEKKFGSEPWIAIHSEYTENDFPLNGLQMLISRTYEELFEQMKSDSLMRNWKKENPNYTDEELFEQIKSDSLTRNWKKENPNYTEKGVKS